LVVLGDGRKRRRLTGKESRPPGFCNKGEPTKVERPKGMLFGGGGAAGDRSLFGCAGGSEDGILYIERGRGLKTNRSRAPKSTELENSKSTGGGKRMEPKWKLEETGGSGGKRNKDRAAKAWGGAWEGGGGRATNRSSGEATLG